MELNLAIIMYTPVHGTFLR